MSFLASFFPTKRIYLDHASAPPVAPEALEAMRAAEKLFGNPGAIHREAVESQAALRDARERIAHSLACKARQIVFTSGLTESNNLAIVGYARALERSGRGLATTHWIVSSIEHDSVLESFGEIERLGGIVTFVEPDEKGIVRPESVERALRRETVLVSVGWANSELGTVQPLADIRRMLKTHEREGAEIALHADAGQAPLYLATTAHSLGADLISFGANKLYGPHGIGALFLADRVSLAPHMLGGTQERGLRAGTENVALACGFAAAFEKAARERHGEARRVKSLRDAFAKDIASRIPGLVVNGDMRDMLPHMLNISIPGINSEYVVLALDSRGIAVSTKSACREGEESESHAVAALGGAPWRARNTLRFSLGRATTESDLARAADLLAEIVASPAAKAPPAVH